MVLFKAEILKVVQGFLTLNWRFMTVNFSCKMAAVNNKFQKKPVNISKESMETKIN